MRCAAVLVLVAACWTDRANPTSTRVAATRPETHEERFESVSLPQITSELRIGNLAVFLSGPVVLLDLDQGEISVLCGSSARELIDQISASFVQPQHPIGCMDQPQRGYEFDCGQWIMGTVPRQFEWRVVEFLVERGGAIRIKGVMITRRGALFLANYMHAFREAKEHARCPN